MKHSFVKKMWAVGCLLLCACSGSAAERAPCDTAESAGLPWQDEPQTVTICLEERCYDEASSARTLSTALHSFEQAHANINIEYVLLPKVAYTSGSDDLVEQQIAHRESVIQQIQAQIMAGEGPDLFLLGSSTVHPYEHLFADIDKAMRNGIFADLNSLFDSGRLQRQDYYAPILQAGEYSGKQMVFPLSFSAEGLLTDAELIEKTGFQGNRPGITFEEFLREISRTMQANPGVKGRLMCEPLYCLKMPLLDYDTRSENLSSDAMRSAFVLDETIHHQPWNVGASGCFDTLGDVEQIAAGTLLFRGETLDMLCVNSAQYLTYLEKEPVFVPIPNEVGGVTAMVTSYAAVRENSSNKAAAMEAIAYLAGAEPQSTLAFPTELFSFPVLKSALRPAIEWDLQQTSYPHDTEKLSPLTQNGFASLTDSLDRIDSAHMKYYFGDAISFGTMGESLSQYFERYYQGEFDYDELIDSVQHKLQLYLAE